MAGGNLLRKAVPPLDSKEDCGVISTRRRNSDGRESPPEDEQGHAAMTGSRARRNGVAPYMASMVFDVIDGMPEAQETARQSGAARTAAASGGCCVRMETRWPEGTAGSEGPGRDNLVGSVRSMTADRTPV